MSAPIHYRFLWKSPNRRSSSCHRWDPWIWLCGDCRVHLGLRWARSAEGGCVESRKTCADSGGDRIHHQEEKRFLCKDAWLNRQVDRYVFGFWGWFLSKIQGRSCNVWRAVKPLRMMKLAPWQLIQPDLDESQLMSCMGLFKVIFLLRIMMMMMMMMVVTFQSPFAVGLLPFSQTSQTNNQAFDAVTLDPSKSKFDRLH